MKKWKLAYSVLFFGVCLTPLVGMGLTKEEASSENRTLSAFPALKTEEGLNVNWLSDAGDSRTFSSFAEYEQCNTPNHQGQKKPLTPSPVAHLTWKPLSSITSISMQLMRSIHA